MKVSIIKYNAGNVQSVLFALERIGIQAIVTDDPEILSSSDKIIFPGVGEASSAMEYLKQKKLDEIIKSFKQPVLGICLGMQLMCEASEEGNTTCLNIFSNKVKRFSGEFKVPQIGWNRIYNLKGNLFDGINELEYQYFVHSYFAEISEYTTSKTTYIKEYSTALHKNNFYGVQFHPEKSGETGQKILENFIKF